MGGGQAGPKGLSNKGRPCCFSSRLCCLRPKLGFLEIEAAMASLDPGSLYSP